MGFDWYTNAVPPVPYSFYEKMFLKVEDIHRKYLNAIHHKLERPDYVVLFADRKGAHYHYVVQQGRPPLPFITGNYVTLLVFIHKHQRERFFVTEYVPADYSLDRWTPENNNVMEDISQVSYKDFYSSNLDEIQIRNVRKINERE